MASGRSPNGFRHDNVGLFLLERNRKHSRLANGGGNRKKKSAIVYMTYSYIQNMPKNIDRDLKKRVRSTYIHFPL